MSGQRAHWKKDYDRNLYRYVSTLKDVWSAYLTWDTKNRVTSGVYCCSINKLEVCCSVQGRELKPVSGVWGHPRSPPERVPIRKSSSNNSFTTFTAWTASTPSTGTQHPATNTTSEAACRHSTADFDVPGSGFICGMWRCSECPRSHWSDETSTVRQRDASELSRF